jgi:uncharacterized protein YggE
MRTVLMLTLSILSALGAYGQEADFLETITSKGHATLEALPDYVSFRLERRTKDATHQAAAAKIATFEVDVREAFREEGLSPATLQFSDVAIPDINQPEVRVVALSTFNASAFFTGEAGLAAYAKLCDAVHALGKRLSCSVKGPELGVKDSGALLRDAVKVALEAAYPAAEAASLETKTRIYLVKHIEITSVAWNEGGDSEDGESLLDHVTCTVEIEVTYAHGRPDLWDQGAG